MLRVCESVYFEMSDLVVRQGSFGSERALVVNRCDALRDVN